MGFVQHIFSGSRQEVNSTWYSKIEEPIKLCKEHYSFVLYILNNIYNSLKQYKSSYKYRSGTILPHSQHLKGLLFDLIMCSNFRMTGKKGRVVWVDVALPVSSLLSDPNDMLTPFFFTFGAPKIAIKLLHLQPWCLCWGIECHVKQYTTHIDLAIFRWNLQSWKRKLYQWYLHCCSIQTQLVHK